MLMFIYNGIIHAFILFFSSCGALAQTHVKKSIVSLSCFLAGHVHIQAQVKQTPESVYKPCMASKLEPLRNLRLIAEYNFQDVINLE